MVCDCGISWSYSLILLDCLSFKGSKKTMDEAVQLLDITKFIVLIIYTKYSSIFWGHLNVKESRLYIHNVTCFTNIAKLVFVFNVSKL